MGVRYYLNNAAVMNNLARRSVSSGARVLARSRTANVLPFSAPASKSSVLVSAADMSCFSESRSHGYFSQSNNFVANNSLNNTNNNPHLFGARSLWTLANRTQLASPVSTRGSRSMPPTSSSTTATTAGVTRTNSQALTQQRRHFVGPFARIIAQFAATAAVVFGKAFAQAFAQAQANAKNPKAAAQQMGLHKKEMDLSQAYEVLNLEHGATKAEVEEKFEKYFTANDPDNGGSFYLQSKVYYAKQAVLKDMNGGVYAEEELREDKEEEDSQSSK